MFNQNNIVYVENFVNFQRFTFGKLCTCLLACCHGSLQYVKLPLKKSRFSCIHEISMYTTVLMS
jgi:hypothetical protein